MFVINRNNEKKSVSFDEILKRISFLADNIPNNEKIDSAKIAQKIVSRMYSGIKTKELDEMAAQICMGMFIDEPIYEKLACQIIINNLHKNTHDSILDTFNMCKKLKDKAGNNFNLLSEEFYKIIEKYEEELTQMLDYNRDYLLGYFGYKTLEKAYLIKNNNGIIERPQHLFLRVAIGIHGEDLKYIKKTYDMMSLKYFTHATPTLFNAGTVRPQMSSCFLAGMEDSIESIFETTSELAKISKWSGGIGLSISNIRGNGSIIRGTNGLSSGIMPLLKTLNSVANYINQGGKRNGSFAVYLEPYHPDIFTFLDAKKNHGAEERRARDLFYALWVPDLFMKRVENNETWSLLCPDVCKNLDKVHGEEFEKLYTSYENQKEKVNSVVNARDVWSAIMSSQIETGVPYMLYKDSCNNKSNQKNLGTIRSSNLCAEIIEYSDSKETAVCNLASICLPKFMEEKINEDYLNTVESLKLKDKILDYTQNKLKLYTKLDCTNCKLIKKLFDKHSIKYEEISKEHVIKLQEKFDKETKYICEGDTCKIIKNNYSTVPQVFTDTKFLGGYDEAISILKPKINYKKLCEISELLTYNLNKVIDKNFYPTEKTKTSNFRHRPIGIGVQGLADLFIKLRLPFESEEAKVVNKNIFETIYYGAMKSSINLAKKEGHYETFKGSPLSQGLFQFDLWGLKSSELSGMWNWDRLREDVKIYGARNSLLIALMPTASTSQIMGNNECIEPYTSNVYVRRTLAGEFTVVNSHLVKDLIELDIWNEETKNRLIYDRGSVKNIKGLPKKIKDIYKTVWEIKQKKCIELSAERSPFVCQSQSLNLWIEKPNFNNLTSAHFYGWKKGLKTGSYYIRSKPASQPQRFGLDITKEKNMKIEEECLTCSA